MAGKCRRISLCSPPGRGGGGGGGRGGGGGGGGGGGPQQVAEYIDNGIPLGAICPPQSANDDPHIVTIIGYDNDYYYVAAGNPDGTANYVRKNELMHYGLYNVTSINQ